MDTTEGLQKNILDATLRVFDQKGLKFTMDDLAKELSISKKTIYTVYDDKEALFLAMVDYIFDSISFMIPSLIAMLVMFIVLRPYLDDLKPDDVGKRDDADGAVESAADRNEVGEARS